MLSANCEEGLFAREQPGSLQEDEFLEVKFVVYAYVLKLAKKIRPLFIALVRIMTVWC